MIDTILEMLQKIQHFQIINYHLNYSIFFVIIQLKIKIKLYYKLVFEIILKFRACLKVLLLVIQNFKNLDYFKKINSHNKSIKAQLQH